MTFFKARSIPLFLLAAALLAASTVASSGGGGVVGEYPRSPTGSTIGPNP